MDFRISDTFTDSLARLTGEEQKAVKTTAFDLQVNPVSPGMQFHKLEKAKDKNFWSVRVGSDVRPIVHRTPESLLLCYAGHHDNAYQWAERRRLEVHPKTGAAQWVEIRERVEEVAVRKHEESRPPTTVKPALFAAVATDDLMLCGVPLEWLDEVRRATDDSLLDLAMHLAKGLEFRAVVVMACEDGIVPLQERIEAVVDDSDLEEVYDTERHLLCVACTPARDHLLVTAVPPASEFLDDLRL